MNNLKNSYHGAYILVFLFLYYHSIQGLFNNEFIIDRIEYTYVNEKGKTAILLGIISFIIATYFLCYYFKPFSIAVKKLILKKSLLNITYFLWILCIFIPVFRKIVTKEVVVFLIMVTIFFSYKFNKEINK
jgi:uncharacterized membrane protein YhaH (DUF805 family)